MTPTPYDELNALLTDLVRRASSVLGDNFHGAYVQGSFALDAGDLQSDCDFLVTTRAPLTAEQEAGIRALHDEIPTRPGHWTHHLEGSYAVADELRSVSSLGRAWLFVDHGWREMSWSTHCNSEVARWITRERGITLAGPGPQSVIDVVPPSALRSAMKEQIPRLLDDLATWVSLDLAWGQRYAVTTYARMLYTLETAEVASKAGALIWAHAALDPAWQPLLEQTFLDRPLGFDPDATARPGSVAQTRAFARYAESLAAG
ncbi:MAG: hypothetical protein JWP11_890 [Frankiales bacterium]|nr:hypothetical protein [Frankiales bacterium]